MSDLLIPGEPQPEKPPKSPRLRVDSLGVPGPGGERLLRRDEVQAALKISAHTFAALASRHGLKVYGGSITKQSLVFASDLFDAVRAAGQHTKTGRTIEALQRRKAKPK